MNLLNSERQRKWRQKRKTQGLPQSYEKMERPFIGCDGEGAGVDDDGRQNYLHLQIGDKALHTGKRLTTEECLDFICDAPPNDKAILVGFSFGYDVTQILRDLGQERVSKLFEKKDRGAGHSPWTYYKDYGIDYLPRNHFRVCRIERLSNGAVKPIKNSARTIYETFGFFQRSFEGVLKQFDVATPDEKQIIAHNKARRGVFETVGKEEQDYCALECELLARVMEQFRDYTEQANIKPRTWNGAGKLAFVMHKDHETPTKDDCNFPPELAAAFNYAYYGGRFEITRTGLIDGPIYEYDICSAYPAAMQDLPCIYHGEWRSLTKSELRKLPADRIYLCYGSFKSVDKDERWGKINVFPVRTKAGVLVWPDNGAGCYWHEEIEWAETFGQKFAAKSGFIYERKCDCQTFNWVEEKYEYRKKIGKDGPGYPIKLGINALYGLLAQRVGAAKFANIMLAGLITSRTRAKLLEAASQKPGGVIMMATDAVYTTEPLELDIGGKLGQWEAHEFADLFLVQPGLYWSPDLAKKKSRGISSKFFERHDLIGQFYDEWNKYKESDCAVERPLNLDFPSVSIPNVQFIGLKLANAWNKPELSGKWQEKPKTFSFDYTNKRISHMWDGNCIITKPIFQKMISLPHAEFVKHGAEQLDIIRAEMEDQPDYVDFSIPFMED